MRGPKARTAEVCGQIRGVGASALRCASEPFGVRVFSHTGEETRFHPLAALCAKSFLQGENEYTDILTGTGVRRVYLKNGKATVAVCKSAISCEEKSVSLKGEEYDCVRLVLAVPHTVFFTDKVYESLLYGIGEKLCKLSGESTRVDIVQVDGGYGCRIISYDRDGGYIQPDGMSGAAAYIAGIKTGLFRTDRINVKCEHGETEISTDERMIYLSADIRKVFGGTY